MTLKKDLIKLLNKYSEFGHETKVLMDAIAKFDNTPVLERISEVVKSEDLGKIGEPINKRPEGVHVLEDGILIVPTPTEDYPKGLIIECNGRRLEGNIEAGKNTYELPPPEIYEPGMPIHAYIKPKFRTPILATNDGVGKAMAEAAKEKPLNTP